MAGQRPAFVSKDWEIINLNREGSFYATTGKQYYLPNGILCAALPSATQTMLLHEESMILKDLTIGSGSSMTYKEKWTFFIRTSGGVLDLWGLLKEVDGWTSIVAREAYDASKTPSRSGLIPLNKLVETPLTSDKLNGDVLLRGWWVEDYPEDKNLKTECEYIPDSDKSTYAIHKFNLAGISESDHDDTDYIITNRNMLEGVLLAYRSETNKHLLHRIKKGTVITKTLLIKLKKAWIGRGSPSLHGSEIKGDIDKDRSIFPTEKDLNIFKNL